MGLSSIAWKSVIIFSFIMSGIIGGIFGVLLTDGLWQALFLSFIIGFGAYLVFLSVTLLFLYAAMARAEELHRDK